MLALGWVINITQRGRASMQRINRLLEQQSEIIDRPPPLSLKKEDLRDDIIMENVSFQYEQKPVLKNISLTIPHGKITAITGRTGSGKSTLIYLFLRFFEPGQGRILVGGHPISRIPLKLWRQKFGYVPQDNFIFSTTIADNIAFARPGAALEEIKKAAKMVALDKEIESFPAGYNTVVGERGVTLSGGQQQRLALARALLAEPEVLILDDALSSVDITTEEHIINNLQGSNISATVIIISHRLKVLQKAAKILVLEDGCLKEEGTHRELLKQRDLYFMLCQQQLWEEAV